MTDHPSPDRAAHLRRNLLRWYDRHRRDLPWRDEPGYYRLWVSD